MSCCSPFLVSMELMFQDLIHFAEIFQTTKRFALTFDSSCSFIIFPACTKFCETTFKFSQRSLRLWLRMILWFCYTFMIQIRLNKNYRSTRCIVEAASSLIQNNMKRCQLKDVLTDNSSGSKVIYLCLVLYIKSIRFFCVVYYMFCSWLLNNGPIHR